jgi:hypothetical protein
MLYNVQFVVQYPKNVLEGRRISFRVIMNASSDTEAIQKVQDCADYKDRESLWFISVVEMPGFVLWKE